MACPFFEPVGVAPDPLHPLARLPLINEHDGHCHARSEIVNVPSGLRFSSCNQGNSAHCCGHFPANEARSALRYNVIGQTGEALQVLCIAEANYAPLSWRSVHYYLDDQRLEPPIDDICLRSQVLAFCRSYVRRFGATAG